MKVRSIVYFGFKDRSLAEEFDEPGFMISPNDEGTDCVNAPDVELV